MSKSQEVTYFKDHSSNHQHRTELPNILRKIKLDPFARTLYWHYKAVAGDCGACYQSNATISEETGMSQTTIAKKRKILEQPLDILGGKSLIKVTTRLKENGEADSTLVEIVDIWPDNFKIFYGLVSETRGIVLKTTKEDHSNNLEEEKRLTEREEEYFNSLCKDRDYDFIADQDKFDVIADYGGEIVCETFKNFFKKHTSLQKGKVPSSINSPIAVFRKECEKTKRWRNRNAKQ